MNLWPMRPLTNEEMDRLYKVESEYERAKRFLEEWRKEIVEK